MTRRAKKPSSPPSPARNEAPTPLHAGASLQRETAQMTATATLPEPPHGVDRRAWRLANELYERTDAPAEWLDKRLGVQPWPERWVRRELETMKRLQVDRLVREGLLVRVG